MSDSREAPDLQMQVNVTLPLGAWNTVMSIIWEGAVCKVGAPLLDAIRPQLAQAMQQQRSLRPQERGQELDPRKMAPQDGLDRPQRAYIHGERE